MTETTRESCQRCVVKHLAQAVILMTEVENGYPEHRYLAIGHLAEAEAECDDKNWRTRFRYMRHQLWNTNPNLEELLFSYVANGLSDEHKYNGESTQKGST